MSRVPPRVRLSSCESCFFYFAGAGETVRLDLKLLVSFYLIILKRATVILFIIVYEFGMLYLYFNVQECI